MYELLLKTLLSTIGENLIPVFLGLNIGGLISQGINQYNLSKYKDGIITRDTPKLKPKSNEEIREIQAQIEQLKIQVLSDAVRELEKTLSPNELKYLYHNLPSARIKKSYFLLLIGRAATYGVKDNTLTYSIDSVIPHELVHTATSYYDKENNIMFSGFEQVHNGASIGKGITDGYGQLFLSRHAPGRENKSYSALSTIAQEMELLFLSPKTFENLFINMDLPGLIQHLQKFAKKEEVIKTLRDIDMIHSYRSSLNPLLYILTSIKVQLKLYDWCASHYKDEIRLQRMHNLVKKDLIAGFLINKDDDRVQKVI
jgi:hypothetical protein